MGKVPSRRKEVLPDEYADLLADVRARVSAARARAMTAVNSELIRLYWEIGQQILSREEQQGWGGKVIDRLAADLKRELPEATGFSTRNLRYMRDFARAWGPDTSHEEMLQHPVAKLPWGQNTVLGQGARSG